MSIELRLADQGLSSTLSGPDIGQSQKLFQHVSQQYKINIQDLFLITKSGHVIRAKEQLKQILGGARKDKTIAGKDFSTINETSHCIYIFSLKEMNKTIPPLDNKFKDHCLQELQQEIDSQKTLRPAPPTYFDINTHFSNEIIQAYSESASFINSLRNSFIKLQHEYIQLKEIHTKNQQLRDKSINQKKAAECLNRYIEKLTKHLDTNTKRMTARFESLKDGLNIDNNSLRQSSGYFQTKKKLEAFLGQHKEKIEQITNRKARSQQFKLKVKKIKEKFTPADRTVVNYENQMIKQRIQQKSDKNGQSYNSVVNAFSSLVSTKDQKYKQKISQQFTKLSEVISQQGQAYDELIQTLTDYYVTFSRQIHENTAMVRETFTLVFTYRELFDQLNAQTSAMNSKLIEFSDKENNRPYPEMQDKSSCSQEKSYFSGDSEKSLEAFKMSIKSQAQVKRRIKFYKKINYLQSYVQGLCAEEESLRKRYLAETKNAITGSKELLKNSKVPSIDIDYNISSDLQLFRANQKIASTVGISCSNPEDFMVMEYQRIIEKVNKLNEKDKNGKIKNLQQILKSLSDVFYKIYHRKYDQMNLQSQKNSSKVFELQEQIRKHKEEMEQTSKRIESLQKQLETKIQELHDLQRRTKEQEASSRAKYEKLYSNYNKQKSDLEGQLHIVEQLYAQVTTADEEVQEMKALLGDKEIEIIHLKNQLCKYKTQIVSVSHTQMIVSNNDDTGLKCVVVENLSEKVQEEDSNQMRLIAELRKDNEILERENELLQQDVRSLQSEIRKIVMKETDDKEIQVSCLQQTSAKKQVNEGEIKFNEEISIGQSVLFMPFTNSLYIGVCLRDQDRTVSHMNHAYQSHYILDLESFDYKTQQFLRQCSLVLVVRVQHLEKNNNNFNVSGKLQYAFGFEDEDLAIRNYVPHLL